MLTCIYSSESGKTTVLYVTIPDLEAYSISFPLVYSKQMKLIHANGFEDHEVEYYRKQVGFFRYL